MSPLLHDPGRDTSRVIAGTALLNALIGWSLLAFGGVYRWTTAAILAGAIPVTLTVRPPIARGATRALDLGLLALVAAVALQLVPLPANIVARLAPHAATVRELYTLRPPATDARTTAQTLSLVPKDTAWALGTLGAAVLVFWSARALADRGASRRFVWTAAWLGLVTAVYAIVARATAGDRIYWWWRPEQTGAQPYGPMVNRNHYAAWLMMALLLVAGHAIARLAAATSTGARARPSRSRSRSRSIDVRGIWLLAALYVMSVALVLSTSRSAILGFGLGIAVATPLVWRQLRRRERSVLAVGLVLATVAVVTWANPKAISDRLDLAGRARQETRLSIWRETLSIVRDFPLTGTGLGTFEAAMTVYQRPPRVVFYNHAHNEYLQLLAEGGLLVAAPAALVVLAALRLACRRLHEDRTAGRVRRVGALAALAALAGQALWEVPLRTPANLLLAAVAAAVLLHHPRAAGEEAR